MSRDPCPPMMAEDPECVLYVHAGDGWGSVPEASVLAAQANDSHQQGKAAPAPRIFVGSLQSFAQKEEESRSFMASRKGGPDVAWVRVEVVREFEAGQALAQEHFEQCWGALIRIADRPPRRAPRFGSPWPAAEEVSPRQWLERAGFAVFLRSVGAAERGASLPGTSEELRRRCGVVAVEDDGFCGFWCLAYLLGTTLEATLDRVMTELSTDSKAAEAARAAKRPPTAEERAWERLWNIADCKIQCLRLKLQGSHLEIVEKYLRRRGLEDSNVFLTQFELALMCARILRWVPVVEVTPDFHGAEETGDHSMLALAALGSPNLEDDPVMRMFGAVDPSHAEALRDLGNSLHHSGFRLITAVPSTVGRDPALPPPSLADLQELRPLIIHLGTHYFLLDSAGDPPGTLSVEASGETLALTLVASTSRSQLGFLGKCYDSCFRRCGLISSSAGLDEARAPLRPMRD